MARVRVQLSISARWQVTAVHTSTVPLADRAEGVTQLTVVAPADPDISEIVIQLRDPNVFTEEIERDVGNLGCFSPAIEAGPALAFVLGFEVHFTLEE
ncbi:hypothetical protein [Lewinella sp. JB7]|uniref:hypothetical protein n=1 Tax=Lewinella sp. JB7 TaxID=2962887 RepID=UPI0020C96843|nr:hypothetical protein [Lewinella sp. JB7]MCP9236620.1 hypothetical protein [Lewinella sp. JB7]